MGRPKKVYWKKEFYFRPLTVELSYFPTTVKEIMMIKQHKEQAKNHFYQGFIEQAEKVIHRSLDEEEKNNIGRWIDFKLSQL